MHVLCVTFGQKFLGDNFAAFFGSFQTTFFRAHTHTIREVLLVPVLLLPLPLLRGVRWWGETSH